MRKYKNFNFKNSNSLRNSLRVTEKIRFLSKASLNDQKNRYMIFECKKEEYVYGENSLTFRLKKKCIQNLFKNNKYFLLYKNLYMIVGNLFPEYMYQISVFSPRSIETMSYVFFPSKV